MIRSCGGNSQHQQRFTGAIAWRLLGAFAIVLAGCLATASLAQETERPRSEGPRRLSPPPVQPVPNPEVPASAPTPPLVGGATGPGMPAPPMAMRRFVFKIDPKTPVKDLLPVAPRLTRVRPMTSDDLARVPEVAFQALLKKDLAGEEGQKQVAHALAKINHLNSKKVDGFLESLRGERADLDGLPFAMGDACRTKGDRSKHFASAVATVRAALRNRVVQAAFSTSAFGPPPSSPTLPPPPMPVGGPARPVDAPVQIVAQPPLVASTVVDPDVNEGFWDRYLASCAQEDKELSRVNRTQVEHVTLARIAALMQVLAPEAPSVRLGLVKYLSGVSHVEATRALARLAVHSAEEEVHKAAVEALKVRRERDYTDVLVQGLRYPWPAAASRAADAIVKLERTDLIPQLLDTLDAPDPRLPTGKGKDTVVQELVRVNHHRNCMLCHAPGNTPSVSPESLTAAVPLPGEPLPSPADGYRASHPDVLVRIDVTYLRQDFSVYQPVADANPWPEMQRFDYLVRTRRLNDEEAAEFRAAFKPEADRPSPYQRAALVALRELTGKDTEPNAAAWRKLLRQAKSDRSGS